MNPLKKTLILGTMWSVGGQLASLLVVLITNIWMARLLSPKEFGQVGIIMFFIVLADVFTEGGLGGALIRKINPSKQDFATVFVFNLTVSVFCCLSLIMASGFIADFYNDASLKMLIIVASLVLIINAFQLIQNIKLMCDLKFKQKSVYRLVAVIISSIVGIIMAYQGAGVWSLIVMQLLTSIVSTLLLWGFEGTFFSLRFSRQSFKELYVFGVNTTLASLLNTAFDNIYQLILGKYFSIAQVGLFYQAKKIQDVPGGIINMLTQGVVFSSLAKLQEQKEEFLRIYGKIVVVFAAVLALMTVLMYLYAENIIALLLGDKWLGAIFYMKLLVIASFFYFLELVNRIIFKIFNQTKQILFLEIGKKSVQLVSIVVGVYFLNLSYLIVGFVITNIISYWINYHYSRKVLEDQMQVVTNRKLKIVVFSLALTFIAGYIAATFGIDGHWKFLLLPFLLIIYLLGLKAFGILDIVNEIKNLIKSRA